ncbi:hypothetical protein QR680_015190 [Steinernema hermaphroditum]|uniref:Uncharacterized protein n=1 Tax=Steinernema hermaphroditum TaxID=289476 RepID=A0AA39ID27_9BILA|nr:hypothetical protein QR680_015190 [Steinernema hermaphroditum]
MLIVISALAIIADKAEDKARSALLLAIGATTFLTAFVAGVILLYKAAVAYLRRREERAARAETELTIL